MNFIDFVAKNRETSDLNPSLLSPNRGTPHWHAPIGGVVLGRFIKSWAGSVSALQGQADGIDLTLCKVRRSGILGSTHSITLTVKEGLVNVQTSPKSGYIFQS